MSPVPIDQVSLVKFYKANEVTLKIENITEKDGIISFKYLPSHRGKNDVHLKIDNDIVASYTLHVTK